MSHTVTAQHSSAKVEGLRAATPYVVQVRARTVAGYGRYSNPMDFGTSLHSTDTHPTQLFSLCLMTCCWSFLNEGSTFIVLMVTLSGSYYTWGSGHPEIFQTVCLSLITHLCLCVCYLVKVTLRSRCRTSCPSSSVRPLPVWWSSLPWWLSPLSALSKCLIFISDSLNYMFHFVSQTLNKEAH